NCDNSRNRVCSWLCDNVICDSCRSASCPVLCDDTTCTIASVLNMFAISEDDVKAGAKKIKANCVSGPDNIPAFFVIDCLEHLLKPLCHLYNLILKTASYPHVWKLSSVFPVFKSGDRANIVNYRPIALLSNFAKLFECVLS